MEPLILSLGLVTPMVLLLKMLISIFSFDTILFGGKFLLIAYKSYIIMPYYFYNIIMTVLKES